MLFVLLISILDVISCDVFWGALWVMREQTHLTKQFWIAMDHAPKKTKIRYVSVTGREEASLRAIGNMLCCACAACLAEW